MGRGESVEPRGRKTNVGCLLSETHWVTIYRRIHLPRDWESEKGYRESAEGSRTLPSVG